MVFISGEKSEKSSMTMVFKFSKTVKIGKIGNGFHFEHSLLIPQTPLSKPFSKDQDRAEELPPYSVLQIAITFLVKLLSFTDQVLQ